MKVEFSFGLVLLFMKVKFRFGTDPKLAKTS